MGRRGQELGVCSSKVFKLMASIRHRLQRSILGLSMPSEGDDSHRNISLIQGRRNAYFSRLPNTSLKGPPILIRNLKLTFQCRKGTTISAQASNRVCVSRSASWTSWNLAESLDSSSDLELPGIRCADTFWKWSPGQSHQEAVVRDTLM